MDDNIVDFGKALSESKSEKATSLEERVVNCMENGECECMYCKYKSGAAEMVVDFLSMDIIQFEKNTGGKVCSYDLKDIFFKAIHVIKEWEKESQSEEE